MKFEYLKVNIEIVLNNTQGFYYVQFKVNELKRPFS